MTVYHPTIIPAEFEKALTVACVQRATRYTTMYPGISIIAHGDEHAVRYGPFLREIATAAGISVSMAKRRMRELYAYGRVLRYDRAGGCTSWWLVGLADALTPAPADLAPPTPQTGAARYGFTPVPGRQHWGDVLGVPRDASTSEVREARDRALSAVNDVDLDAHAQRERIRAAYSERLKDDNLSEYE